MSSDIDYESIEIPPDESPDEYSWQARRAEILEKIKEAGHPRAINQSELADRYGCSQPNIHNDMQVLAEYVHNQLGDNRVMISEAVFNRAMVELMDDRQWAKAARVCSDYNEWIDEYRRTNALEERIDQLETLQERQP